MLIGTLTVIVILAVVGVVLANFKPQPVRVRRQPTRDELLAQLLAQRDDSHRW